MDFSFPYQTLTLNEEQAQAVLRSDDSNQRIVASAGSGKTTTLTARIALLITEYKVKPESIVLMTFSRNAATDMIRRIEKLIGPTNIWAGTFHGLSRNLLRTYDPTRLGTLYFIDELISMGTAWLVTTRGRLWVSKLRYIVVDEFQDINAAQWKMVERMLHPGARLLVVGDDAQNIYTWRGSDVKFILDLEKKVPGLVDDQLRVNYRSTEAIIACANAVMRFIPTLSWKKSMLGSEKTLGKKPDVHFFWRMSDESRWILETIREIRKKNKKLSIAILSRTNIDLFRIEEELLGQNIPYRLQDCNPTGDRQEALVNQAAESYVDLVTLHASKGLEWDLVFVIHCNDQTFPSSKKKEEIICERRLFYVAVTRARKHLIFTYCRNERDLSRFIREIPSRLLTYHGLARYCLSEAEINEGIPTLESLLGSLDGDDYKILREEGCLAWLDMKNIREENLFPPGETWTLPLWAKKPDLSRDFLRFLKTFIKRLFAARSSEENMYRDPVAERLLFTLRIFSEDRIFWEQWHDELTEFIMQHFSGEDAARVPPPIDYAMIHDWCKRRGLEWSSNEILAATSLIAKIRGQLRPLRFETYDLNEFTVAPARFVVPTEMRGEILRSWRAVTNLGIQSIDILEDIWRISTLQMVGEGRNAPLYRVGQIRDNFHDTELIDFLNILETCFTSSARSCEAIQVGLEIVSEWTQPESIDIFADGVFWRIAGEEKERVNSLRLLLLAITAGFAQLQGISVHSIGMIYPLEGRSIRLRLPVGWTGLMIKIIQKAIH
jgi:hypothetical protein